MKNDTKKLVAHGIWTVDPKLLLASPASYGTDTTTKHSQPDRRHRF